MQLRNFSRFTSSLKCCQRSRRQLSNNALKMPSDIQTAGQGRQNLDIFQRAGVTAIISMGMILGGVDIKAMSTSAPTQAAEGFTLPALPYGYSALEPYIDETTMKIHHSKHHQAYITKLNDAVSKTPALQGMSLVDIQKVVGTSNVPADVAGAVRNNGGGTWNHGFFWKVMSSPGKGISKPTGELAAAIEAKFGTVDRFKELFSAKATGVFGSGWAWLIVAPDGSLEITTTPNQDNPLMAVAQQPGIPVIGIDVWEHAYYLKHQNKRPDYVKDWFQVTNWEQAEANYKAAKAGQVPSV